VLILQEGIDTFDECLDFTFHWILMLMTGSGKAHRNSTCRSKVVGHDRGFLGRSGVIPEEADPMAITMV